ncbi:DUF7684 family protein [Pseudoduganella umbonata]|uniref:DUF7684 family protein n=1 Tax=Pseudoduganella umbonata TaxID=864828 RepID=UPI003FCDDEFA
MRDAAFVVTTWHDDEQLPEVFWFARHVVEHPRLALDRVLIVHIAAEPREQAWRGALVQA